MNESFKLYVNVAGRCLAIGIPTGTGPLIQEIVKISVEKYNKLYGTSSMMIRTDDVLEIRMSSNGATLDQMDATKNLLAANDFITIVLRGDGSDTQRPPVELHQVTRNGDERIIYVDGNNMSPEDLIELGNFNTKIQLSTAAVQQVQRGRYLLDTLMEENRVVYGINTGFGKFANTVIDRDDLNKLQENLIRSHAAGVGQPLSPQQVRRLLALRINVLAKGHSGCSIELLEQLVAALNANCLPEVPSQGTVGASGDLAPLAHLALGLLGEGRMWSISSGWSDASKVLQAHGLKPISLKAKEGLALLNGTQLITAIGIESLIRAENAASQADVIAALSLDVLKGTTRAFDYDVHRVRPHAGQQLVAQRLRSLLSGPSGAICSELAESHRFCGKVQDAYTLRCCPQVHGIVIDTLKLVRTVLTTEMNSATDNPLVFANRSEVISGGNFHGEYPAKVCDYLAIAVHELASMSERRLDRLVNPALSGLPAFLVNNGGLNSGFMIAHCTAAALVSEDKVLCHPASVDSLPTSAGTEDHVSMGGFAARKALQVVCNVEKVLAIELLAACQAIDLLRPLKTTPPLEQVYKLVRSVAGKWDQDRYMAPDINSVTKLIEQNLVWKVVEPFLIDSSATGSTDRPSSPTTSYSKRHRHLSTRSN